MKLVRYLKVDSRSWDFPLNSQLETRQPTQRYQWETRRTRNECEFQQKKSSLGNSRTKFIFKSVFLFFLRVLFRFGKVGWTESYGNNGEKAAQKKYEQRKKSKKKCLSHVYCTSSGALVEFKYPAHVGVHHICWQQSSVAFFWVGFFYLLKQIKIFSFGRENCCFIWECSSAVREGDKENECAWEEFFNTFFLFMSLCFSFTSFSSVFTLDCGHTTMTSQTLSKVTSFVVLDQAVGDGD